MNKSKQFRKKLRLARETVRELSNTDLKAAAGGPASPANGGPMPGSFHQICGSITCAADCSPTNVTCGPSQVITACGC